MRHLALVASLAVLGALLCSPTASAEREGEVVEAEDGQYVHLFLKDDPAAQAWLYRPMLTDDEEDEAEEPASSEADLIVALHGAGGNPKNFVLPSLMEERGAWCLAVAGHQAVTHERGQGFMWGGGDVSYVVTFVEYLLEKHPIRKDRVIVWGHSAGGTMTLATLAAAPKLFAGGLTTAAPATPDGRHKAMRICVFLGTEDPNWGGAGSVRSFLESVRKKRRGGACAFFAVEGLGHELPYDEYLDLGFSWILCASARGGEATVGRRPKGSEGDVHHILVRHKGAEGAEGVKRSRSKAQRLLKEIRKAVGAEKAFFPFEAACHSEDEDTASGGGGIDTDDLEGYVGELPDLESGALSEILESPRGLHLVWRP